MLPKMKGSHFVKKYSVQFVNQRGKLSEPFYFIDNKPHESQPDLAGPPERVRPAHARTTPASTASTSTRGSACWRCCSRATGPSACGSRRRTAAEQEVRAKVVVDASGQSSMLMDRLGLREWDPVLKKAALWTYWKGAYRDTGRDEGDPGRHPDGGQDGLVLVHPAARRHRQRRRGGRLRLPVPESRRRRTWRRFTSRRWRRRPGVQPRIKNATRCDIFRAQKEYSYRATQAAGNGWVLVGDAFGFLDPLYSSGRAAGADQRVDGGRRDRRGAREGRHVGSAAPEVGGRVRSAAWTGCAGWCASSTTGSASAGSSASTRT